MVSLAHRETEVIGRLATLIASGAPLKERASGILEELESIIPIEGGIISRIDPVTKRMAPVALAGCYTGELGSYMTSDEYQEELIGPFALPSQRWPVRECDLPVDPLSLRCVSEYFRPAGLVQGLVCALVTADDRYVGFIDVSGYDDRHPTDEACAVVGCMASALASLLDPLESARTLVSNLEDECLAVGLIPGGGLVALQGIIPDDVLASSPHLVNAVSAAFRGDRKIAGFLWPRLGARWYRCTAFECRDRVVVVTIKDALALYELTHRELEVLTCLVDGKSNDQIARDLYVTVRTVKAHVEHILKKLEVANRAGAVRRAVQEGLTLPAGPAGSNG